MKKIMLGVMALSLVFVAVETSAKSFSSRSSSFRSSSSFKSSYKSSSPSYSYKSSSSSSTSKPRTSVSESNSVSYAQKNLSTNSYTPVDSYQRKTIPVPAPASKPGLSTGQKVAIGAAAVGTGVVAHEAIAEHADSANHIVQPGIPHDNTTTNTSNRNNYSGSSNNSNSGHYTTYSQPVRTPRPAVRNSNSWMHYYLFRSIQRPARPYYAYNSHYAYRMSYLSLNDWERTRNATRNYVSQFDSVQTFEKKAKAQCTGEVYLCDVMDNADFIYDAAFYRGFSEALGPKATKYGIPDLHASVYNTYMRDFNGHKYMLNQIPDNIKGDEVLASLIKQAYFTGYSVGLYTAKNRL